MSFIYLQDYVVTQIKRGTFELLNTKNIKKEQKQAIKEIVERNVRGVLLELNNLGCNYNWIKDVTEDMIERHKFCNRYNKEMDIILTKEDFFKSIESEMW